MSQLEKLQSKNNKLALMVIAMGARINEAFECTDPFEAAAAMHNLVEAFECTVGAFEEFGDEVAKTLDSHIKALNGGTNADDEFN